jgi:hypothetical protein
MVGAVAHFEVGANTPQPTAVTATTPIPHLDRLQAQSFRLMMQAVLAVPTLAHTKVKSRFATSQSLRWVR